jgi:hypothetical protein
VQKEGGVEWEGRANASFLGASLEQETIKKLDKEFRLVLDKTAEIDIRSQALSEIRQRLVQGHPIVRSLLSSALPCGPH